MYIKPEQLITSTILLSVSADEISLSWRKQFFVVDNCGCVYIKPLFYTLVLNRTLVIIIFYAHIKLCWLEQFKFDYDWFTIYAISPYGFNEKICRKIIKSNLNVIWWIDTLILRHRDIVHDFKNLLFFHSMKDYHNHCLNNYKKHYYSATVNLPLLLLYNPYWLK